MVVLLLVMSIYAILAVEFFGSLKRPRWNGTEMEPFEQGEDPPLPSFLPHRRVRRRTVKPAEASTRFPCEGFHLAHISLGVRLS